MSELVDDTTGTAKPHSRDRCQLRFASANSTCEMTSGYILSA